MSIIEKKEKNLNQLINKLNSISLTYSQPSYEVEKIKTEKNEILRQKSQIENKNQELLREHKYLKDKIGSRVENALSRRSHFSKLLKPILEPKIGPFFDHFLTNF